MRSGCDLDRLSFSLLSLFLEPFPLLGFLSSGVGGARGEAGGVGPLGDGDLPTSLARCFSTEDWFRKSSGISVISWKSESNVVKSNVAFASYQE